MLIIWLFIFFLGLPIVVILATGGKRSNHFTYSGGDLISDGYKELYLAAKESMDAKQGSISFKELRQRNRDESERERQAVVKQFRKYRNDKKDIK